MGYTRVRRMLVSGLQEILLVVLLFVLIFILPSRLGRGRSDKKPEKSTKSLSGKARLGVIVSAVWLSAWAIYFRPWSGDFLYFTLVGLSPVILGWGVLWVIDGFRKDKGR